MNDTALEFRVRDIDGKAWAQDSVDLPIYPSDFDIRESLLRNPENGNTFTACVPLNTPVRAMADGALRRSDYHEKMPLNSLIILSHGDPSNLASYYQGIKPREDLTLGIKKGEIIGYTAFPEVKFSLHNHPMAFPELAPIVQYLRERMGNMKR